MHRRDWWPPGHGVGWGDTFTLEVQLLLEADRGRRLGGAPRGDVRGRLPRRGGLRRDPAFRGERRKRGESSTDEDEPRDLGLRADGHAVRPGGYQPQWAADDGGAGASARSEGLGDLIDGYEFHYPQELSEDNLDEVREALGDHDIYCIATGLHLDPRFGKGGLTSPDEETRAEAGAARSPRPTSPARSARTSSSGPGSRATTTRSRRPTRRAGPGSSTASARPPSAAASTASCSSSSTRTRSPR